MVFKLQSGHDFVTETATNLICLDSYSRQVFNFLAPFCFMSVFESTAYLKFTKLQYVSFLWLSLPGDYRVTDEALLAETT